MSAFFILVAALMGLAFGSFMNVVVYRVPLGRSINAPRSACPKCGTTLTAADNVPVLSWLALRGRCRTCGEPISVRYPLGEALVAGLWVAVVVHLGQCVGCHPADAVAFLPFVWTLVCLSFIDLDHKLIPSKILYPALAIGAILLAIAAPLGPGWGTFGRAVAASAASFAVFNVIHFVSPAGMGYGDVRLSAYIGLYLGYLGWGRVYAGFLIGFFAGAAIGIALMAAGKAGRKTAVPFGPFLAAGAVVSALWGAPIVRLWAR